MFRFLSSASARRFRRAESAAARASDSLLRPFRDATVCQQTRLASSTPAASSVGAAGASGASGAASGAASGVSSGVSSGASKIAAKAGVEIPSFAESIQRRFGSVDGRDFVLLTAGLALAGLIGERILSDRHTSASASAARSHHPPAPPSPSPSQATTTPEADTATAPATPQPEAAEADASPGSADAGSEEVL
ncbi:hypothetical protein CLOP_g13349 [Closterium sp. NIES-67]|nr:hypothetical protein CLOP_g13349 [Closterium sp. NIES-67]